MEAAQVSLFIAFMAGLLSFISPCVLPLVPSYLSFITGLSFDELAGNQDRAHIRWKTMSHSLLFIAGFSTVFISFGASATLIGQFFLSYQGVIRKLGGILIVLFGLYILGLFKVNPLMSEHRWHPEHKPAGYLGSFLIGISFAAGWTPCVGPILGTILLYASTTQSLLKGMLLLTFYSIGLGLPLFLTSLGVNSFLAYFRQLRDHLRAITVASGLFLIAVGLMIFTNSFTLITAFLTKHGIGWYVGQ
jgi:cytochrome c-type biogenesis protein